MYNYGYFSQLNKLTHFIDGSGIYGSNPDQTGQLRSFEGGKMKVFNDFGRDLLPLSKNRDACLTMEQGNACFESGNRFYYEIHFPRYSIF